MKLYVVQGNISLSFTAIFTLMQAYSDNSLLIKAPIGQQPYPLLPTSAEHEVIDLVRLRKKRRSRRFGHALVSTVCLGYLAYLVFKNSPGLFHRGNCSEHGVHETGQKIDGFEYTIPSNLSLVHCVNPEEWSDSNVQDSMDDFDFHHSSDASFDLPLSSATLFLISRGQNLGGIVNVVTSDEQADDSATVLISLRYNEERVRDWTKVCLLARDEDENGVGVFTPIWRGGHHSSRHNHLKHRVNYQITVTLPAPLSDTSPLQIKYLETDLLNTAHRLEDLTNVSFDRISLRATNGPIDLESLTAQTGSIVTTNGHIAGTLKSSLLSILSATNGPIKVSVNLTTTESHNATFVAHTTNAPIRANITLISTAGTGGTFDVSTTTTNSPLVVTFPKSPVGSTLHLGATTTNSPAVVSLDSAYEGSFDLRTSSFFQPRVHVNADVTDPAGKDRQRKVEVSQIRRGEVVGDIRWGDKPEGKGVVIVSTTNSPVSLDV